MSEILLLIPYLFACALFFIFLALGLRILVSSRDTVLERFGEMYFSLTHRSYDESSEISENAVVSLSRVVGGLCLTLSGLGAWMLLSRILGA